MRRKRKINAKAIQVLWVEHPKHNLVYCYHKGKQYGQMYSKELSFEEAEREFRWLIDGVTDSGSSESPGGSCIFCGRVSV